MITYKWKISTLDCEIDENGLENVIKTIHWRFTGEDQEGNSAEVYGAQAIGKPKVKSFISTDEIIAKPEIIEAWLEKLINMDSIKLNIDNQIALLKNPKQVKIQIIN